MADLEKAQLRQDLKDWCAANVPVMNAQHAASMAQKLVTILSSHVEPGSAISCYIALQDEVDSQILMHVLRTAGYKIVLPVVIAKDRPLIFRLFTPGDALAKDVVGLPVPSPDCVEMMPDAVVIPVLGFNKQSYRLGRGGGYYDRTLSTLQPILTIGLGYDGQQVDFTADGHDIPLDYIVTESRILTASTLS